MKESIRVLLADDHQAMREGLAALITRRADMSVVAEASNGAEAVQLFREYLPDVTLMDLQMPIMDGIEAIRTIHAEFPKARVIVLTAFESSGSAEGEAISRSLNAGAVGYLLKDGSRQDLLEAIQKAFRGEPIESSARHSSGTKTLPGPVKLYRTRQG